MIAVQIKNAVDAFIHKYKIKEALIATSEGIPVYYYKNGRRTSEDPYVLSAKISSVLEMARSMSRGLKHVLVNDRYGRAFLVANDEYVFHMYLSNNSEYKDSTIISNAKRLLTNIKKIANS
ncbi:MAG: hypothetical protein ACP6IU_08135 [Candidatus Asgardarchaeia archaeon]|nr:MAG: hypothetical protein DRO67_03190 [Candidatus Asgardarchaeum californiense]